MDIVYKRILIINDDDTEEAFWKKYHVLQKYKDVVHYCNHFQDAFKAITAIDFHGYDKIVLDIKIDWEIPEEYRARIADHIYLEALEKVNMGFMIFMYLISRGYPIKRIAFLSAYITEQDHEYQEKLELMQHIKKWKARNEQQDQFILQFVDKIPSLKERITGIIESKNEAYAKIRAYREIGRILSDDIAAAGSGMPHVGKEIKDNQQFFDLLEKTGIKISEEQKISKSVPHKLEKWITAEKDNQYEQFYRVRCEMLNICERVKNKKPYIYKIYNQRKVFKKNYSSDYFEKLISKVQYEVSVLGENRNIETVMGHVMNSMVAFWENLDKKYIGTEPSEEDVNYYALTMVLKHTRNWCAHGRLEKLDIKFCEFIFLLSIRLIYGEDDDIADYVKCLYPFGESKDLNNEVKYIEIWKGINNKVVNQPKELRTNTYTINLAELYYKYSSDRARGEIHLTSADLADMFILCLHYPYVKNLGDDQFAIGFHEIEYRGREKYMVYLEEMALEISLETGKAVAGNKRGC